MSNEPILTVTDFNKRYGDGCEFCQDKPENLEANYCPQCGTVYACRDVNLELYPGEIVGVVGESGSGKSTLMQALYFDNEATSGDYRISNYKDGEVNLFDENRPNKQWVRNMLLGMVYQNPMMGLRMDFTTLANIAEKMIAADHRHVGEMIDRSKELLDDVNIPFFRAEDPPKKFSGGMQQRAQIAKALSNYPPILLLDEVTTGLDLSVQADVLDLIKVIQRESGISMIVVSHDLGVIRMLTERTLVMYNGEVIESGLTDQVLEDPQHAYTQQLVYSLL